MGTIVDVYYWELFGFYSYHVYVNGAFNVSGWGRLSRLLVTVERVSQPASRVHWHAMRRPPQP